MILILRQMRHCQRCSQSCMHRHNCPRPLHSCSLRHHRHHRLMSGRVWPNGDDLKHAQHSIDLRSTGLISFQARICMKLVCPSTQRLLANSYVCVPMGLPYKSIPPQFASKIEEKQCRKQRQLATGQPACCSSKNPTNTREFDKKMILCGSPIPRRDDSCVQEHELRLRMECVTIVSTLVIRAQVGNMSFDKAGGGSSILSCPKLQHMPDFPHLYKLT